MCGEQLESARVPGGTHLLRAFSSFDMLSGDGLSGLSGEVRAQRLDLFLIKWRYAVVIWVVPSAADLEPGSRDVGCC